MATNLTAAKSAAEAVEALNRGFSWVPWLRLLIAGLLGAAAFAVIPKAHSFAIKATLGWDFGVLVLIGWSMAMMALSPPEHMRRRAARQDLGRWVILLAIPAGALINMLALAHIQKTLKASPDDGPVFLLAVIVVTIVLSWSLVHTVFALHYAHGYYGPSEDED